MADSNAQVERRNGGGSGKPPDERPTTTPAQAAYSHALAYHYALAYALARALVSLAVKGSGLLALLLSTVVLLGGFVSSLGKMDFSCITVISVIQAAGIFKDWERSLKYVGSFMGTFARDEVIVLMKNFLMKRNLMELLIIWFLPAVVVVAPLWLVALCVDLIYLLGPFACAAISLWRIAKLNHGKMDGTDSMADMMAALNIFYSLIIFQGTMFGVLVFARFLGDSLVASHLLALEQLSEKWGKHAIRRYISDINAKCRKDSLSIMGRDLIKYAVELLDSESQDDYLYGARLLSAFIKKGEDVRWLLLPSKHRIQRLIESLVISSSSLDLDGACVQLRPLSRHGRCLAVIGSLDDKKEIRELAATIVAHIAAHIDDLSMYPGAMQCISTLLQDQEETTQTYRNQNSKQLPDDPPPHQRPIGPLTKREHYRQERHMQRLIRKEEEWHMNLMKDQKRMAIREHRHRRKREGGTSNELVQQGLTILEGLASNNNDNRSIICSTPGLLPKITAPVYSATLIEDVKTKAWADIVTRCLKVLYQLIRTLDGSHDIFSNNVQALTNLKSILELGNNEADHQELQLVAMEILTELPLDLSIRLNEEIEKVLITKQLQLFLANRDGAAMAGRTLVSLSTKSGRNSALIKTIQHDIIDRLTGILEDENITRRKIAAEIMANLCAHCTVDNMKEILPKVLREIMSIKIKSQQIKASADQKNPALGDEENQGNSVSTKVTEERQNISTQGDDTEKEQISDQERDEQEVFLSLAQVICDKVNSADLDGAIQNAVQNEHNAGSEEQRREAFVDKLKTIIEDNCHPAADSLRIVKLCCRIAESTMRCQQYVEIFRNKGFKSSLSEASKTMSELESCMLFVGTDFGLKKTVRPLFSEIEKSFGKI